MTNIDTLVALKQLFVDIRNEHCGFTTNLYVDDLKHGEWIADGRMQMEQFEGCYLVTAEGEGFSYLFFIACDMEHVDAAMEQFLHNHNEQMVIDVVGMDSILEAVHAMLQRHGFLPLKHLVRMSRVGAVPPVEGTDHHVVEANDQDLKKIYELLHTYFDARAEQLPSKAVIRKYARDGLLLVFKDADVIKGFIMFELTRVMFYLRYWFTLPEYRNQGIASALYAVAMTKAVTTKRQMLWVLTDNENARKRYVHYGYKEEKMKDYVMIRPQIARGG